MKKVIYALAATLLTAAPLSFADDPPADPSLAGDTARSVGDTVKRDAKTVAAAAKEGAQKVATTAKQVGHEIAKTSREGAQQVKQGAKQVGSTVKKGGQNVKAAVSGDKPAKPVPATPKEGEETPAK